MKKKDGRFLHKWGVALAVVSSIGSTRALNHLPNVLLASLSVSQPSTPMYSNSTSAFPLSSNASQSVTITTPVGRYGHSAVYLTATNTLLFIGGQVGSNGTYVTSQVLSFNLASAFLFGPNRVPSIIPDNPSIDLALSNGLPAHAWAASAVDLSNRTWLIGGVTENCEKDAGVYVLPLPPLASSTTTPLPWCPITPLPRAPARRRQIQAVSVFNLTTLGNDFWVLGGIAEQYTCSDETIGYVGLDRWNSVGEVVESMAWDPPDGESATDFTPPVSDYTATLLKGDETSIAVIGGQTAAGDLVNMSSILVFNTELRNWERKNVTGPTPASRMGHVSVSLPSGSILVHGGLSTSLKPIASEHLLIPPSDLSAFSTANWTWCTFSLSNHSMVSPARAWHSATMIDGGTIVVAFGINSRNGEPSEDIWFLTVDEERMEATWTDTFGGNLGAELQAKAVMNPKLGETSTTSKSSPSFSHPVSVVSSIPTTSSELPWTSESSESTYYSPAIVPSTTSTSTLSTSSTTPSSEPTLQPIPSAQSHSTSSSQQKSIATGVGSALALVAVLAGVVLFVRRHRSQDKDARGVQLGADDPVRPGFERVPVSSLLYTKKIRTRALSLGSTISIIQRYEDEDEDDEGGDSRTIRSNETRRQSGTTGGRKEEMDVGTRGMKDPFSDNWAVTEMGELTMVPRGVSDYGSPRSIPYLHTVHRTTASTSSTGSERRDEVAESLVEDSGRYTSFPTRLGSQVRRGESDVGTSVVGWDLMSEGGGGTASRKPSTLRVRNEDRL